jgi:hypothetical protein
MAAVKKLPQDHITQVTAISCFVTCPECKRSYSIQMRAPITRKNCYCGKGSFQLQIIPAKRLLQIIAVFTGANLAPVEYPLTSQDIEIAEN